MKKNGQNVPNMDIPIQDLRAPDVKVSRIRRHLSTRKKLVLCAVLAALSVALLYVGGLSVLDLTTVAVCSLITMLAMVETGEKFAWLTVAVTGILALLLLPSKLLAMQYIFFGGVYPILKASFEKLHPIFCWLLKLSTLDSMLLAVIAASKVMTGVDAFLDYSWLVILIASLFFVLYDRALSVGISVYIVKLRKRLGLKSLF